MRALRRWCTSHLVLAAVLAAIATAIYLVLAVIAPKAANVIALGYLVLIGTIAVIIDLPRDR